MSTKPTDLPRFAVDDGTDTDAANISPPPDALRDVGYALNAVPTAANFNYFLNSYYRWLRYLSDGAFSGTASFANALTVAGTLTTNGSAIVNGAITINGALLVKGLPEFDADTFIGALLVVADFVFTAANATDTLTKVAHGLLTGDGPVRVSNAGGALPAGLSAGVDYWVITLTADTFKLATTLANAIAGTPINITTDGTGTQTLSDTASTRRPRNLFVARSATVGHDLQIGHNTNLAGTLTVVGASDLSGALVAHSTIAGDSSISAGTSMSAGSSISAASFVSATNYRRTATRTRKISPTSGIGLGAGFGAGAIPAEGTVFLTLSTSLWCVSVELEEGEVIGNIRCRVEAGDTVAVLSMTLMRNDATVTGSNAASLTGISTSSSPHTITAFSGETVGSALAGYYIKFTLDANTAGDFIKIGAIDIASTVPA